MKWPSAKIADLERDVRADLGGWWDADNSIDPEHVLGLSYARFLYALHEENRRAVEWIVFFVAERALRIWEGYEISTRPRAILESLRSYLALGSEVDWTDAMEAEETPYKDCRFSDSQSSVNALAEAARYIHLHDPIQAVYCVSSADVAYDHVLTEDRFREWFLDYAVRIAMEDRDMTTDEREAMRHSPRVTDAG